MKKVYFALMTAAALGASLVYAQNGESLYGQCAACHGTQGGGGSGPALAGDQNLEKAPYVIDQILHGGGGMPAYDSLSNGEVAAVASYVRSSFGNSYGEVSAKQVAAQRGGESQAQQTQSSSQADTQKQASSAQNSPQKTAQKTSSPLAATKAVQLEVPSEMATPPFDTTRTLNVPQGFDISVYARIPNARFMTLTPEGDLLVSQPDEGKVSRVTAGNGGSATVSDFLTGLTRPHDLVFHQLNGKTYLFVAESDRISRFTYQNGNATNEQVVVAGLPDADSYRHPLKSLAIDSSGTLYAMIASSTNAGPEDLADDPKRGAIYTFDASATDVDATAGKLFAQGLRNAEGLAFVPDTNELWAVINDRDQIAYPFHRDFDGDGSDDYGKVLQSYVDNHPPDEFTRVVQGGNYGWPFCNPYPDTQNGYNDMPFNRDVETNPKGQQLNCNQADRINQGIQAHSAPLGLLFLQNTAFPGAYQGAVTPLHGSWNRDVPTGYKVVYFPWQNGVPGEQLDLVTGWLPENAQNGEAWGRPVDAAVDAQGNLFISDDASGTVYKLSPETQSASN